MGCNPCSTPKPPAAPDPYATSAAQTAANKETALTEAALNRFNQYTPYGSLEWSQPNPNDPTKWSSTVNLDPRAQELLNLGLAGDRVLTETGMNRIGAYSNMPSTISFSNLVDVPTNITDPSQYTNLAGQILTRTGDTYGRSLDNVNTMLGEKLPEADAETRKRVEDALYGSYTSRLDPRFAQEENALSTRLANQGIDLGSSAYSTAYGDFGRTKNDAYQQAQSDAVVRGGEEMQRLLEMELARRAVPFSEAGQVSNLYSGAGNTVSQMLTNEINRANALRAERNAQINEQVIPRNQILNEIASLDTGTQVQAPTFLPTSTATQVAPTPISSNVYNSYQGDLNAYSNQTATQNALIGGLARLGGGYLSGGKTCCS